MHRFIPYSFVVACLLAVMPAYARDVGEWTGVWDTIWTDGGGRITLQQDGDSVTGEFPLYKSRLEGKVRGDRLEGRRIEGERSYAFVIVLGHDARSFAGRDDAQGWWTGARVISAEAPVAIKLATPRDALVNFVFSASQARCGLEDYWARAADSVEFHPETAALPRAGQLRHLQEFFDLVDLTTFRMWEIATDAPSVDPEHCKRLRSHQACHRAGMAILEGVVLDGIPEGRYELIALPLPIAGVEATPVRAILRELA